MITELDLTILDFIQAHLRNGVLDRIMPVITLLGEGGIFWIALTVLLLLVKKTRPVGIAMAIALVLDVLLCNVLLKPLVARARPWTWRPDVVLLVKQPTDYSFPSGHTAASFAAAGALTWSGCRWGWAALVLATLIGLSRLYLFVHFPTDVLGGMLLGLACGFCGAYLAKKSCKSCKNCRN